MNTHHLPSIDILPSAIRLNRSGKTLEIKWARDALVLSHLELRRACKCAECERMRRAGLIVPAGDDISIRDVTAVGTGAIRLGFSDGHERGIFPFVYLRQLALKSAEPAQIRARDRVTG